MALQAPSPQIATSTATQASREIWQVKGQQARVPLDGSLSKMHLVANFVMAKSSPLWCQTWYCDGTSVHITRDAAAGTQRFPQAARIHEITSTVTPRHLGKNPPSAWESSHRTGSVEQTQVNGKAGSFPIGQKS
jgi:hypothetical protein